MRCAFPSGWKAAQVRSLSLVSLSVALPGQKGVPHCYYDIDPLCQGHPLEEVQRLFFILPWLDPILLKLHIYILISLEPPKILGYLVM